MPTSLHANGYRVIRGSTRYPNLTAKQRRPWLKATQKALKAKANDWRVRDMLSTAAQVFGSCVAAGPNRPGVGKHGNPATRAATIVAHILKQRRYSAQDVLLAGLAAQIQVRYDADVPLRSPYYRAVQVGRAIHLLLKAEPATMRTYDDGHGNFGEEPVKYRKIQLQSRNVCQQLEKLITECAGDFVKSEGGAIEYRVYQQLHQAVG